MLTATMYWNYFTAQRKTDNLLSWVVTTTVIRTETQKFSFHSVKIMEDRTLLLLIGWFQTSVSLPTTQKHSVIEKIGGLPIDIQNLTSSLWDLISEKLCMAVNGETQVTDMLMSVN